MTGPNQPADREARQGANKTLTAKTLAGLQWTYLSAATTAASTLVFAAVMGRLLEPAAFGLVAMANVVLRLASFVSRMGVGQAVIQRANLVDAEIRAAFTSGAGLGAFSWAVVWLSAPYIGTLYQEPNVVPVVRALGATLFVMGLGSTADSLLRRAFRFRALAMRRLLSDLVGYLGVGITFALLGAGVWSLVAATVAQVLLNSLLSYSLVRHPLRPVWEWRAYRSLYAFGSRVSVISVFEFLGGYVDKVFVGRFAGSALLGQYDRGYMLATLPLHQLNDALTKVLFPGFSRIQANLPRVKQAYLGAISVVAAVIVPICAGMAVASRDIVVVLLGTQWGPAADVLPIFLLASAFRFFSHFGGVVTEAIAELNKKLLIQSSYVVLLIGLMTLAVGRGILAYATALAAGEVLRNIAYLFFLRRVLDVRFSDVAPLYGRAALAGAVVAASIAAVRYLVIGTPLHIVAVLLSEVTVGAVALLLLFAFGPLRTIVDDLVSRLSRAGLFDTPRGKKAWRLCRIIFRYRDMR